MSGRAASSEGDRSVVRILGVRLTPMGREQALELLVDLFRRSQPAHVAYANAHSLNTACRHPEYRAVLHRSDAVLNDGAGVALAAKMRGRRFPANLNGSDLTRELLVRAGTQGWPVFLLGGRPGVAEEAARCLSDEIAGLRVVGSRHGYIDADEEAAVSQQIAASGAGLLLVAMGNPLQELWIDRNLEATGVRLALGVGAFFDFASRRARRAPAWMNDAGIEWVYRLIREPGRLWRRYLLGNPEFLARALWSAPRER